MATLYLSENGWAEVTTTATPDATTTSKGVVQLAGDLAGTAASPQIAAGAIVNSSVSATAAIAYSKLNLSGSVLNADIASTAAIAYSKLNLSGSIVNADVSASAAIAYSKLNLANSIVNADIAAGAAIALSKLATDPLARANHTGTQTASTISNFDTQVRTSRLDQMAAPTAAVSLNSQKITSLATATANTDAANKAYVDGAVSTGGSLNYSTFFGTPMFMLTAPASTASGANNNARTSYVIVMTTVTLTGIIYRVGATASGNVKAGLFDSAGNKLAETTATVAQATAGTSQQVNFASTYTATPGQYFIQLTFSSSTATFQGAVSAAPSWSQTAGSFAAAYPTGFASAGTITVPMMTTA